VAQTPADFYQNLLRRGIGDFDAGRYDTAISELRIAAFGLIDASDRYQLAHIYTAVAADRLKQPSVALQAANRVVAAERIQKTFASLTLPPAVRSSFDAIAKKTLSASDYASLSAAPQPAPAPASRVAAPQPRPQPPPAATPATEKPRPVPVAEKPAPEKPKPAPVEEKPAPARTEPAPEKPPPQPQPVERKPVPAEPKLTAAQLDAAIAAAERSLSSSDLTASRRSFRGLLDQSLTHEQLLQVAEGLYRAHDFSYVIRAFDRAGALRRGEEPYRYYLAVALYETGRRDAAKKELTAALPFIEITPDVDQYRRKIEGTR
jgi:hypothetical protein